MKTASAVVRTIDFSFYLLPWILNTLAESPAPCEGDPLQSQSSPRLHRAYFAVTSGATFVNNLSLQDLGSSGGIYLPRLHDTSDNKHYEML